MIKSAYQSEIWQQTFMKAEFYYLETPKDESKMNYFNGKDLKTQFKACKSLQK